jgi:PAS domain S-box-containing protein
MAKADPRFNEMLIESLPFVVFQCDGDFNCFYINRRWTEITGMTAEQSRGRGWMKAIVDKDAVRGHLDREHDSPRIIRFLHNVKAADGSVVPMEVSLIPVLDGEVVLGFAGFLMEPAHS